MALFMVPVIDGWRETRRALCPECCGGRHPFLLLLPIALLFVIHIGDKEFRALRPTHVSCAVKGIAGCADVKSVLRNANSANGLCVPAGKPLQRGRTTRKSRNLYDDDPGENDFLWAESVPPDFSFRCDERDRAESIVVLDLDVISARNVRCGISSQIPQTALSALCESLLLGRPPPGSVAAV